MTGLDGHHGGGHRRRSSRWSTRRRATSAAARSRPTCSSGCGSAQTRSSRTSSWPAPVVLRADPHGALNYFFAPVMPYRQGRVQDDPRRHVLSDRHDHADVHPADDRRRRASRDAMPAQSAELKVNAAAECPPEQAEPAVRLRGGHAVLIFDESGAYDTLRSRSAGSGAAPAAQHGQDLSKKYGAGSKIVQIEQHTYYLNDVATKTYQLMHYDGDARRRPSSTTSSLSSSSTSAIRGRR